MIAQTSPSPVAPRTRTVLRLGYLPLTDAAPLLVAQQRRFFARHGVQVELCQQASWAALRDRIAFSGALHGAQMLAPMPLALALELGGPRRQVEVTATLSRNGNTIVLGNRLLAAGDGNAAGLAARLAQLAADSARLPVLAVVFAFSAHNYLLRHWLATLGIVPDRDVRLIVLPPSQVVEHLADGMIDGFCAGEPWGSQAVAQGVGHIVQTSAAIWPDHPEKLLAFAPQEDSEPAIAATAALIEAGRWADDPANREETVRLLCRDVLPLVPPDVVARMLDGGLAVSPGGPVLPVAPMVFAEGTASYPAAVQGAWFLEQMRRWGHLAADQPDADAEARMRRVWRADLWAQAAGRLGIAPPDPAVFAGGPAAA